MTQYKKDSNIEVCIFKYNLGIINYNMGNCIESKVCFTSAYETARNLKNIKEELIPIFKIGLGAIAFLQGKHKEALNLHTILLPELEKSQVKNSIYVAHCLNNFGFVWKDENRYDKTRIFLKLAREIYVLRFTEDHPIISKIYNHMSLEDLRCDLIDSALKKLEKATTLAKKYLDEKTIDVARIEHNKGYVYDSQGNYDESLRSYQKALNIYLEIFKNNHPDIPIIYHNIGHVYSKKKNIVETLSNYKKALDLKLGAINERKDPGSAVTCRNFGFALKRLCLYQEAMKYIARSFNIDFNHYGKNHSDISYVWNVFDLQEKITAMDNSQNI